MSLRIVYRKVLWAVHFCFFTKSLCNSLPVLTEVQEDFFSLSLAVYVSLPVCLSLSLSVRTSPVTPCEAGRGLFLNVGGPLASRFVRVLVALRTEFRAHYDR